MVFIMKVVLTIESALFKGGSMGESISYHVMPKHQFQVLKEIRKKKTTIGVVVLQCLINVLLNY